MACWVKDNQKDHAVALLQKLVDSREDEQVRDFIIRVDNHDIYAHRNILAVSSDYFKAMLNHDTIENKTGVVNMKDVDYKVIKNCIDFLYSGEISFEMEYCRQHLYAATLMQLHTVRDHVVRFMCLNVSTETFFEIKDLASIYDLELVHAVCNKFALKHLNTLAEKVEFDFLEQDYILILLRCQDTTHPDAEDDKMRMLLKWIKADVVGRQDLFAKMIKALDMSKISDDYKKELAEEEPLCYGSEEIMGSLQITTLDDRGMDVKPADDKLGCCGFNSILTFDEVNGYTYIYDFKTKLWSENFRLNEVLLESYYVAAVVGDVMYVICSTGELYTISWKKRKDVWNVGPRTMYDHGRFLRCVYYDGYVYVCGNYSFERFYLGSNQWQGLYQRSFPSDRCAIVELKGVIYAIGGDVNLHGKSTNVVHKYKTQMQSLEPGNPMTCARATPGACAHGDKIYVAGGFSKKPCAVVEQYDPDTENWTRLSPMTFSRSNFALIVVSNRIFACGHGSKPGTVEEYDPETDKWSDATIEFKTNFVASTTVAVEIDW